MSIVGTQSVEAVNFLISWCWNDLKPRSRLGVRVYTSGSMLRNGTGYCLSLDHLMKDEWSPEYKKGNGLIVLKEVIAKADEVKVPITLVCKDALIPYYEQVGFVEQGECDEEHVAMFRNVGGIE